MAPRSIGRSGRVGPVGQAVRREDGAKAAADVTQGFEEIEKAAAEVPHLRDDQQREADRHDELADANGPTAPERHRQRDDATLEHRGGRELEDANALHRARWPARRS